MRTLSILLAPTLLLTLAVLLGMTSHGNAQTVSNETIKEFIIQQYFLERLMITC
jgi:hypothetical protein